YLNRAGLAPVALTVSHQFVPSNTMPNLPGSVSNTSSHSPGSGAGAATWTDRSTSWIISDPDTTSVVSPGVTLTPISSPGCSSIPPATTSNSLPCSYSPIPEENGQTLSIDPPRRRRISTAIPKYESSLNATATSK